MLFFLQILDVDEDMDMEMIEEETIVHSLHAYPPYTQSYHNQPYSSVHNQGKHNNYSS